MAVKDLEQSGEFEIRARVTVNATGPWAGMLDNSMFGSDAAVAATGYSRGSHLVTRRLIEDYAIALPTQYAGQNIIDRGGRHIFILPWRGHSLIGTSYVEAQDVDDPVISSEEIDQLIGEVNRQLPGLGLSQQDILHTFSGIYPLQDANLKEQTYQGTGDYQIVDHAAIGREGIISAVGAKFTTARLVAEKAANLVAGKLDIGTQSCRTRDLRLSGADYADLEVYLNEKTQGFKGCLDELQVHRLIRQYGTGIEEIAGCMQRDAAMARPLCDSRPNLAAEVRHAVEAEMAIRLDDVIYRRTGMGTIGFPGDACVDACAAIMAELLGWDDERRAGEVRALRRYRRHLDLA